MSRHSFRHLPTISVGRWLRHLAPFAWKCGDTSDISTTYRSSITILSYIDPRHGTRVIQLEPSYVAGVARARGRARLRRAAEQAACRVRRRPTRRLARPLARRPALLRAKESLSTGWAARLCSEQRGRFAVSSQLRRVRQAILSLKKGTRVWTCVVASNTACTRPNLRTS